MSRVISLLGLTSHDMPRIHTDFNFKVSSFLAQEHDNALEEVQPGRKWDVPVQRHISLS